MTKIMSYPLYIWWTTYGPNKPQACSAVVMIPWTSLPLWISQQWFAPVEDSVPVSLWKLWCIPSKWSKTMFNSCQFFHPALRLFYEKLLTSKIVHVTISPTCTLTLFTAHLCKIECFLFHYAVVTNCHLYILHKVLSSCFPAINNKSVHDAYTDKIFIFHSKLCSLVINPHNLLLYCFCLSF